eukprot:15206415-Alexandrium_andersonii.AAC.1
MHRSGHARARIGSTRPCLKSADGRVASTVGPDRLAGLPMAPANGDRRQRNEQQRRAKLNSKRQPLSPS